MPLAGRPMVEWSIEALRAAPSVAAVVVALPPTGGRSSRRRSEESTTAVGWEGVRVVEGGAERADSVANALDLVETDLVAIHDAARPLLSPDLVEGVVATLLADPGAGGAIAATPATDTIKRAEAAPSAARSQHFPGHGGEKAAMRIVETIDRDALWAAQTPQVFRVEELRRAMDAGPAQGGAATDEAMLVEEAGGRVLIHPSLPENLKVTTPLDLHLAGLLLEQRQASG